VALALVPHVDDSPQRLLLWVNIADVAVTASPPLRPRGGRSRLSSSFDLTPGLESRSSCPEAIWQAATWWHGFYPRTADGKAIKGAYSAAHDLVPDALYGGSSSPVVPTPAPAATPVASPLAASSPVAGTSAARRPASKRRRQ
jgi:hypothetical protein